MERYPTVSIVIPHYGKRKTLKYLLKSILRSDYPKDKLEIIIVIDDAEQVYDVIRHFQHASVKIKVLPGRLWYSASNRRNIGGLHSEGDILAFIDDDIILSQKALKKLVKTLIESPKIGCARSAIYLFRDGQLQLQTLGIRFYKRLGLLRAINLEDKSLKGLIEIDAGGGVMVVPRRIFLKIMFDERLPFLYEDLDFVLRIKKLGYRVVTVRDAVVFHYKEHKQIRVSDEAILKGYFSGRNSMIFYHRHGGIISILIRFYVDLIQSFGKIIYTLIHKRKDDALIEAYRIIGLLCGIYALRNSKHKSSPTKSD